MDRLQDTRYTEARDNLRLGCIDLQVVINALITLKCIALASLKNIR